MAIELYGMSIVSTDDEDISWNDDDNCDGWSAFTVLCFDGSFETIESHFDYSGMSKHFTKNRVWVSKEMVGS